MKQGIDISNFTSPLTAEQVAFIEANCSFAIIGLQSAGIALAQQSQLQNVQRMYYVDKLGRNLAIPEPDAVVAIDIESGCFTDDGDVVSEIATEIAHGLQVAVYGNRNSIPPVIGDSTALALYPLWYADYRDPGDWSSFVPFNGWAKPWIWQYSSGGEFGINCDLDEEEDVPTPITQPTEEQALEALIKAGAIIIAGDQNLADLDEVSKNAIRWVAEQVGAS